MNFYFKSLCRPPAGMGKILLAMKLVLMLMLIAVFQVNANTYGQTLTLKKSNTKLVAIFKEIRKQTGYDFFYSDKLIEKANLVSLDLKNASIEEGLKQVFSGQPFVYAVEDKLIMVKPKPLLSGISIPEFIQAQQRTISGKVTDEKGLPMIGVSVLAEKSKGKAITDSQGQYSLKIEETETIVFNFVGYQRLTLKVDKSTKSFDVKMVPSVNEMDNVVITGYFNKTNVNFTGAAVTIQAEELKKVGSLNLIQALNAFDPSIRLGESLVNGSNPNVIPDITVRGETGFDLRANADNASTNPNAPLYILDGIEVSAQRVYDLDMNRVETATILKDASATALYGSRGANGVIVITLVRPKPGQIRINLNASTNISTPDLRDYNLMNASQKLEYEQRAGVYKSEVYTDQIKLDQLYNSRLEEVGRGVNTYWLSQPLQTAVNQRYSLNFEGGDNNFRYGIDVRYDTDKGVMKQSGRDKYGINVMFDYNIGDKLFIRNDLSTDNVLAKNSPYNDFSTYANQNPYDRIYDENGEMVKKLSTGDWNPLADVHLPRKNSSEYATIQDNLNVDWRIMPSLRFHGRFSYTKQTDRTDRFKSPASVSYTDELDPRKKGEYTLAKSRSDRFDGNITLSYNKSIDKHTLSAGLGSNAQQSELEGDQYTAIGFVNPNIDFIGAGIGYKEGTKPTGSYDKARLIGFFGNLNYGYDNRYFLDVSYRTDGSSKFGRNSRFAPFWSTGIAWNIHNEHWWNSAPENTAKIRASAGSTGSTNFSSSQAMTTYLSSFSNEYNNVFGVDLAGYGNPNLKWQNTISYNIGIDFTYFKGFITFNGDFYIKNTQNLLLPVTVAPSTGFIDYVENVGRLRNTGVEGRLRFNLINDVARQLRWNVTLMAFHNKSKITRLSDQLETINQYANDDINNKGNVLYRKFEAGRSQTAIMVVPSAGIDPATGNELYIKRDGSLTFEYNHNDKVVFGDMKPTVEGSANTNLSWKGLNLFMLFKYQYGGKAYNGTLASKVEGSNPYKNADLRVLEERWKEPGDHATFRRIDDRNRPYQTSRLVFDDNVFALQSVSLSYELPKDICKQLFTQRAKFMISSTDLFRMSTIKQERGTSYPFARTLSLGLNVTF